VTLLAFVGIHDEEQQLGVGLGVAVRIGRGGDCGEPHDPGAVEGYEELVASAGRGEDRTLPPASNDRLVLSLQRFGWEDAVGLPRA
jgi:hypothetical protein